MDIATQGKSEKEVMENISDLIVQYLNDPDTPKLNLARILRNGRQTANNISRGH